MAQITINGRQFTVDAGRPLVEVVKEVGIYISNLCYVDGLAPYAGCRTCAVEIEGARGLPLACTTPVQDGTPKRSPSDVVRYNRVAMQVATARGIAINDLYSLTASRMTDLQPLRNVHFTEAGAEVLATQVTRCIRAALSAIATNTGESRE